MESLFTHPLTMVAGAALVSSPIIIHLINRMRFRRIHWAAMEFLLKAQKRMRRKLILEQLILLLLRCLLVFLVGMLLARLKWFSTAENQDVRATAHVVVLDDTPSMSDVEAKGEQRTAFEQGKMVVWDKIAPAAVQSNTPQSIYLLRVSEPRRAPTPEEAARKQQRREERQKRGEETDEDKEPLVPNVTPFERLSSGQVDKLKSFMGDLQPSSVNGKLVTALKAAAAVLDEKAGPDTLRVIHLVSDLRAKDWAEEGEGLKSTIATLTASGVRVHIIDTALPFRRKADRTPPASENVAIVELRPLTRVAAKDQPVDFEVRVKNFGAAEQSNVQIRFFRNGKPNIITTREIPSLPASQERREVVQVSFDRVATEGNPLDRFNLVTAVLAFPENGGLAADNYRHAVIEVEPQRKVLVVEGRRDLRNTPEGDGFYLRTLFSGPLGGIKWEDGEASDLEKKDLRQYAVVFLLNVRDISPDQAKKLEDYVRDGGGLSVFLGPNIDPKAYNATLYKDGQGVFPVPLPDQPSAIMTPDQFIRQGNELAKWILVRDPAAKIHPALGGLYTNERGQNVKDNDIEKFFPFLRINRHWPVARLGGWTRDPSVRELYCLANDKAISTYEQPARELMGKIERELGKPKFQGYRKYFLEDRPALGDPTKSQPAITRRIQDVVAGFDPEARDPKEAQKEVHLARLARYMDELLRDQVTFGDDDEPFIRAFWTEADPALRDDTLRFRDQVKYGDPLYLVKQFGQGRVAAITTTAGDAWTDWPAGLGKASWVPVMTEMYRYLSAGRPVENRVAGEQLAAVFDPARGRPNEAPFVSRFLITADPTKLDKSGDMPIVMTNLEQQPVETRDGVNRLAFGDSRSPGVYVFAFPSLPKIKDGKEDGTAPGVKPEEFDCAAFAVNIDADHEGQLARASYDDVIQQAPGIGDEKERIHSPDNSSWVDSLKQGRDDLSTRRWLYLLILLVLLAEQAMAVRLSHHARAEDLEAHAPTAAAAYARGTTPVIIDGPAATPTPTETAGV